MMKQYKKDIILTTLITLLPIFIGLILWNQLPNQIAIHFDFSGTPNNFVNKPIAIAGLPLFMAIIHLFCIFVTLHDPKKQDIGTKMLKVVFWIIPLLSNIVSLSILYYAYNPTFRMTFIVYLSIGILFIILGNYMSKTHQNYTVGIRLPWTLNSRENWNKTHRFASKLWVFSGIILMINSILNNPFLFIIAIIISGIIPMIYSFILYKKGI